MGIKTNLRNLLEKKSEAYFKKFKKIESQMRIELSQISIFFPDFPNHGYTHSRSLEEFLNIIIPFSTKKQLNTFEIFILLCSIYLHDIGLVGKDGDQNDPEKLEEIRKEHHMRSRNYISKNYKQLGLDIHEANLISSVCYAHRGQDSVDINSIEDITQLKNSNVRLRFLASCLRFADECDITYERVDKLISKFPDLSLEDKEFFMKHANIPGIAPSLLGELIEITAIIDSNKEKFLSEQLKEKIQKELDFIRPIFQNHGINYKKVFLNPRPTQLFILKNEGIYDKLLIELLKVDLLKFDQLKNNLNVNRTDLELILDDLINKKIVLKENDNYKLNMEFNTIDKISRDLLFGKEKYNILQSKFFQRYIDQFMLDFIKNRFKIYFNDRDLQLFLNITKLSPSAFNYVLYCDTSFFDKSHEELEKNKQKYEKNNMIEELQTMSNNVFVDAILSAFIYDSKFNKKFRLIKPAIKGYSTEISLQLFYKDSTKDAGYFSKGEIALKRLKKGTDVEAGQLLYAADLGSEISLGLEYIQRGNYKKAIKLFSKLISRGVKTKEVWNNLGVAYYYDKKYKKAINYLDNALKLDPQLKKCWSNRGLAVFHMNYYKESIKNFDRALDMKLPTTLYFKGLALLKLKNARGAIKMLEEAKNLGLDQISNLWYNLATAYFAIKDIDNALIHINQAIYLNNQNYNFKFKKAIFLESINKFQESLQILLKIQKEIENDFEQTKSNKQDYSVIKKDITILYNLMAWNNFKLSSYKEGEKFSKLALKYSPKDLSFLDTLACNQFNQGKIRNAKKNFDIVLKGIKKYSDLKYLTIEEARVVFEKSKELKRFEKRITLIIIDFLMYLIRNIFGYR